VFSCCNYTLQYSVSELALAMRRLHDSFVALAGRLQTVHNSVEMQKEQYLNLRKYFLKDSTNVFEEQAKKSTAGGIKPVSGVKISPGPTPFSGNYILCIDERDGNTYQVHLYHFLIF